MKGGRRKFHKKHKEKKKFSEVEELENLKEACKNIVVDKVNTFADLPLTPETLKGLKENKYTKPTEVQKESLCISLRGLDVLGAAKTGSGKTLAFVIPILELLYRKGWMPTDGLGALVITPTRELAYQIFETLRKVGRYHNFSAGLIIGGNNVNFEKKRMSSCNIVIGTPGRLLQHMDETPYFNCDNLQILILDEADLCLDMGFQKAMNCIIENIPVSRQTLLFSATQTKSVRDLARLSLKDPMYVSVHEHAKHCTPEGLQQSYVICKLEEKLDMLWSFIRNHRHQKILVFLSSCKQVKYHYEIFCRLRPGITLLALYGHLSQQRRMANYESFCSKQKAVLFATDIAARGLDFPEVHWIFQLDCPPDTNTYIHRVGRTARYYSGGESLLLLLPSEEKSMVEQLKNSKIPIHKIRVNSNKIVSPLKKMQAFLAQNPELKYSAQRAFITYLKAVHLMKDKSVFNINALDTDAYARSLGMIVTPKIRFLKKLQNNMQEKSEKLKEEELIGDKELQLMMRGSDDSSTEEPVGKNNEDHSSSAQFHFLNENSDSEGDDLLQLKRKDHDLEGIPDIPEEPIKVKANSKKNSKVAAAKKLLKKKIIVNKKQIFNEDGEAVVNRMREKVSDLAREYESENVGGIDIEKAKTVLREEDKFDKELYRERVKAKHREKKLKLKQAKSRGKGDEDEEDEENEENEGEDYSESGSEPDLSWLPDPDKIYGPKGSDDDQDDEHHDDEDDDDDNEDSDDEGSQQTSEADSEETSPRKQNRKRSVEDRINTSNSKRSKIEESKSMEEQLDLMADEELALHFLKNS